MSATTEELPLKYDLYLTHNVVPVSHITDLLNTCRSDITEELPLRYDIYITHTMYNVVPVSHINDIYATLVCPLPLKNSH